MAVNPLYASVRGSNPFEESFYFDLSEKTGLGTARSIDDLSKRQAVTTTLANATSIATFNVVRAPAVVSASAGLQNTRTVRLISDSFNSATQKAIDFPATIVNETSSAIKKKADELVNEPIKAGTDFLKLAVIAFIIYLVVFRK